MLRVIDMLGIHKQDELALCIRIFDDRLAWSFTRRTVFGLSDLRGGCGNIPTEVRSTYEYSSLE